MFKSPIAKDIASILLYGAGVASVSMIVWTAGPYIAFGDYRPLDNYIVREVVIVVLVAVVAAIGGMSFWRRRKNVAALEEGVVAEEAPDDSETLGERMKDAIATLKASSGGRSDFLYDLPWYVIIGPPGAGKTTALVNSGLRFPLSHGATPTAIAGAGGTRYCDWWFTEDAVLIDTAGRYTTQDSDATLDKKSWLAFLDLLKTHRPKQPINGVIIAISLQDLLTLSQAQIAEHARAIRARLVEIHDRLKVDFPVYALFTKSDLVAGFVEFFADLDEHGRRQVWGATFQTADKKKNMVGETPAEFDALIARLNERMPDRLQDEPAPAPRVALYGFPAQMASLKRVVHDFLNAIFEPTRYHANAALRGFYFTSGTQEGTPIDQLIVALVRNFGAREVRAPVLSGLGKSYFLNDLIQKVIIGEAAWVSTDVAAVRRQMIMKATALGLAAALALGAVGVWWMSYTRNLALVGAMRDADIEYVLAAGDKRDEDVVGDRDFDKIEPLLRKLRYMPDGFQQGEPSPPLAERFGLSQRARLHSSAIEVYRVGLERLLRPRLLYRLEEVLDAKRDDPSALYDALKVYMMLGGAHALDRNFVLSWERQDWRDNLYPGAGQESGRAALEDHLRAMLDLDDGSPPLVELSSAAIENAQRILARLSVAQRAYQLLKSQARDIPDWSAQTAGGLDADRVFETTTGADLSSVRVPGFYTYRGFQTGLLDRLGTIADKVRADKWVLGRIGEETDVAAQFNSLPGDVYQLYAKDFVGAWKEALARLQLRRLTADKPRYLTLSALAAPSSPLRALMESVRDETSLTRERPKPKGGAAGAADRNPPAAPLFNEAAMGAPGASIEAQFRPLAEWVEGSPPNRPIDQLLGRLNEIKDNLIISTSVPAQAAQANASLQAQLQNLRAAGARLPPPFDTMISRAAGAFETEVNNSLLGQLTRALGNQVTGPCLQLIPGRYPFDRGARREIALADFGRLFGVGGVMDRFFQNNLAKYVDQSKRAWIWRRDDALASTFSPTTLVEFQRAEKIRDAFFSTGGVMPSINIQVFPPILSGAGATAKFEANGASVTSQAGAPAASGAIQWPGAAAGGRAAVSLAYDPNAALASLATADNSPSPAAPTAVSSTAVSAVLERTGAWALFRLLDAAGARQHGDRMSASFILGGRELQYQFAFGTSANPYLLPALREFRCPAGL
ncbi:type VI secretion system membrane subunit TssM [Rhodoblastus acidophilus]|uniref:Type VI secretion system membrane subunit TssM n=1 Tax=Candidatus Rhodoblastus alkanivorans TaxID=2954117 RepID=A0ABS9Z7X5_9HYPH|nr:type VI secretion system membrane subunit TssM [Candidatus Rhodoblastus alkanivorans]MCI4678282.1 type VI secretion system membrane subunit TssM [Candidatus Rhodoblastus alkanivorans]MCI4683540.1 type VI secretion system membrane subunit TssM [Candidatus Rhodoblastus alkanivorans]MDI4640855.1 type VI secretion system membrane subunit TssM [Rhodoblastus acidophilus]